MQCCCFGSVTASRPPYTTPEKQPHSHNPACVQMLHRKRNYVMLRRWLAPFFFVRLTLAASTKQHTELSSGQFHKFATATSRHNYNYRFVGARARGSSGISSRSVELWLRFECQKPTTTNGRACGEWFRRKTNNPPRAGAHIKQWHLRYFNYLRHTRERSLLPGVPPRWRHSIRSEGFRFCGEDNGEC